MPITRRGTFKALAATVAGVALPSTKSVKAIELPVTPHAIGKCPPDGDICEECYEVMTEDYEEAVAPVVERALAAFWESVQKDLPFFRGDGSMEEDALTDAAREAIAYGSFDQWQTTPKAQRVRAAMVREAQ